VIGGHREDAAGWPAAISLSTQDVHAVGEACPIHVPPLPTPCATDL
jgi:hypothetical protein